MNRSNKNDFTNPEVALKSRYKLWVKYKNLHAAKVYYSYEKAGNPNYGYNRLMVLVGNNRNKIKRAILYNNHTGVELERYSF